MFRLINSRALPRNQRYALILLRGVLLGLLWLWHTQSTLADELTLSLENGNEISLQQFGSGTDRVLWLPAEFGLRAEREMPLAQGLADLGPEVWLADLHGSYFIPPGRDSLAQIPLADVVDLIRQAQPQQGRLYLLSTGRGGALALMAARELQLMYPEAKPLGGLLLFHPNLQAKPPQPGFPAEYLPVASLSSQPIYLIQPGNSAKRWYLRELVEHLEKGGSDVFTQIIPGVSDGFHQRPDFTTHEAMVTANLPKLLYRAIKLLDSVNRKPRTAPPSDTAQVEWRGDAFREALQPFPGEPLAPALALPDLQGRHIALSDYRGKLVLVNFWTTWCPPCVKEIPSLGRLQERLGREDFAVLSVDIGETAEAVTAFLRKVEAGYPVLLDPEGTTVKAWDIRAFPTSFLLDCSGRIRYAYFGALEWDDEDTVQLIRSLR